MWSLLELGLSLFFGFQKKKATTEVQIKEIEAKENIARVNAQAAVLKSGSWMFQLFFIVPLGVWYAAVVLYSMLWCGSCIYPYAGAEYSWSIAALPSPLNEWSGGIIAFLFFMKVRT